MGHTMYVCVVDTQSGNLQGVPGGCLSVGDGHFFISTTPVMQSALSL